MRFAIHVPDVIADGGDVELVRHALSRLAPGAHVLAVRKGKLLRTAQRLTLPI